MNSADKKYPPFMISAKPAHTANGSMPVKKTLFNRPSWSKPQALTNGTDLFHRSNQTYIDLAAEAERQRKRKLARRAKERARRAESAERAAKRQQVSESEDDDDQSSDSEASSHRSDDVSLKVVHNKTQDKDGAPVMSSSRPECSPKSLLKRYEATVAAKKLEIDEIRNTSASHIIDLEDEDGISEGSRKSTDLRFTASDHLRPPVEDDELISDEEFPELARQARERARRRRLEEDTAYVIQDLRPNSQDGCFQRQRSIQRVTPPPPTPDPILQIFITSSIPNTTPLIVNRKLSQRLKDVRLAWLERQHFPSDVADQIFLTWRGKRLFDVTSCRALGISAGPNGRILAKGDNVVDDEGRIHMEAMTVEILEAYQKAKRIHLRKEEAELCEEPEVVQDKQEPQIKVICKAKGFPDFKLIVKPVLQMHAF